MWRDSRIGCKNILLFLHPVKTVKTLDSYQRRMVWLCSCVQRLGKILSPVLRNRSSLDTTGQIAMATTKKENLALIPAHPYYILLYSNLVYSEASLDILPHTPRKNYQPLKSDLYSTFASFCLVLLSFKQNMFYMYYVTAHFLCSV